VTVTAKQVTEAGQMIQALVDAVGNAAQSAAQIVASSGQQAVGMTQIRQAMTSINTAVQQNLASTRQAERAAQDLSVLGTRLLVLVGRNGSDPHEHHADG
jgi:methyl-accepting chemotaxis protein